MVSRFGRFTPEEPDAGTCYVGIGVGPGTSLNLMAKRKILTPAMN